MEIKTTNTASFRSKTVHKLQDLLIKFEQSLFKAIVTNKINSETFVINSQVGSFQINSKLDLKLGDELILKVKPATVSTPDSLIVTKIVRPTVTENVSITKPDSKLVPTIILNNNKEALLQIPKEPSHFVAKIVAQDKHSIHLQDLKGQLFSFSKNSFDSSFNLKNNDYLAFKWLQPNKIEIQSINNEQLLHQAQRQLLPKQSSFNQPHQRLAQAAFKLFQAIQNEAPKVDRSTSKLTEQASTTNKESNINITALRINNSPNEKVLQLKSVPFPNEATTKNAQQLITPKLSNFDNLKHIKQELQNIIKSFTITPKAITAESIQKLLFQLDAISNSPVKGDNALSFVQKLTQINQLIDQLLAKTDEQSTKSTSAKDESDVLSDLLKTVLRDSKQTIEMAIHKLLFQNTTAKLNQEVNVTQLINTQIPFELDKRTKDCTLKIKQHKSNSDDYSDSWEIHLSFEMGALGLISTKIMLKDNNEVSVLFWAELSQTKQLIDDKKGIFQQQMDNAGFKLEHLSVFLGKPLEEETPIKISTQQFIDINV